MRRATFAALMISLLGSPVQSQLIVNGDFETGDFNGWNMTGNVVVFDIETWGTSSLCHFNRGDTTPNGSISQAFVTSPGQLYELHFDFGIYTGHGITQTLRVEVVGANTLLNEFVTDPSYVSGAPTTFENYVFSFVADSHLAVLIFSDLGSNYTTSTDSMLDNVSVTSKAVVEVANSLAYHSSFSGSGTPPWNRLDNSKTLVKEDTEPQLLTQDNLINTAQGINGIVFDIENLPDAGNLSVEDFEFQVSPQGAFDAGANPPANWPSAPAPSSITVTPGSPDRVLIQWPDQSIMNRWLRITVLATEETGLAEPETYYIGHLLGETTGPSDGVFTVSFADITPIRSEVGQTVDASSIADIDKNGTVSFADISAMRGNVGSQLTQVVIP